MADGTMAFRMWEYDIKLALRAYKLNDDQMEFDFPKSCVIYIAQNGNYPKDGLELKVNFQDGQHIMFKVPVIRLQDYKLDEIDHKKLWLFFPFLVLQYSAALTGSDCLSEQEVLADYKKIVEYMEAAYNNAEITIDENATLLEAIQETNRHAMKRHQKIMKGVEDMISQTLELKHKKIAQKTVLKMLSKMKTEGIPEHTIVTIAESENISEEEIKKILAK